MNGLTLVALLAVAVAIMLAWRAGVASGRRAGRVLHGTAQQAAAIAPVTVTTPGPASVAMRPSGAASEPSPTLASTSNAVAATTAAADPTLGHDGRIDSSLAAEHARLVRSLVAENATLRARLADAAAIECHLGDLAQDRRRLFAALGAARADTARYRALVIDLENNAPPPLLDGPSAPDDLKLIVGIGPVLARLLQQMGITSYRQIARWSERDIDDFDARLPEFPGRIRRDAWVTQARALHQSKYGEALPVRDR